MTQVFGCTSDSSSNVAKRCTNTWSSSKDHLAKSMDRRTDTLGCAYKDIANDLAKGLHCAQNRIFQKTKRTADCTNSTLDEPERSTDDSIDCATNSMGST